MLYALMIQILPHLPCTFAFPYSSYNPLEFSIKLLVLLSSTLHKTDIFLVTTVTDDVREDVSYKFARYGDAKKAE